MWGWLHAAGCGVEFVLSSRTHAGNLMQHRAHYTEYSSCSGTQQHLVADVAQHRHHGSRAHTSKQKASQLDCRDNNLPGPARIAAIARLCAQVL